MEQKRRTYPAVDCFKFICCILVIAIHAKPFQQNFWLDAGVGLVTRFAVPYFFVASGFFFFSALKQKADKRAYLIQYELRLLRFYAVWFVIHTAQSMLRGYVYSPWYYIRHFLWPNNGAILWFLPATMFAVLCVYLLSEKITNAAVFSVSVMIWLIGYCLSTLAPFFGNGILPQGFLTGIYSTIGIQNGLFFALPYIAMSKVLAECDVTEPVQKDIAGVAVSFCCLAAESLLVMLRLKPTLTFLWLSVLPMTWYVFRVTMVLRMKDRSQYTVVRKVSTLVYVIHPVIIPILRDFYAAIGFHDFQNLVLFFSTILISVSLSLLVFNLSRSRRFGLLRYIM